MIADPFKVLGITESATDVEVKKAYREMSKKYHPDANPDNQEAAEEKFKEIQEAYRQIVNAREHGTSPYGSSSSYGGAGYGGAGYGGSPYGQYYGGSQQGYGSQGSRQSYGGAYQEPFGYGFEEFFNQWARYSEQQRAQQAQNESNEMRAAANLINAGQYQQAITALSGVRESDRDARWYYYYGVANSGMGNNFAAQEAAKKAVDLDPSNEEYRQFFNRVQYGRQVYRQRGNSYGATGSPVGCLTTFCLANLCCNMFLPGMFCCM
ncbi:MAG: DnaJ domain-containing protein [Lachnospiraceae bacterium]|nr:DnaJ domain-containing protein [Candidatus Equihabitans merdae]